MMKHNSKEILNQTSIWSSFDHVISVDYLISSIKHLPVPLIITGTNIKILLRTKLQSFYKLNGNLTIEDITTF